MFCKPYFFTNALDTALYICYTINKNFLILAILVNVYMKDFFNTLWNTEAGKAFRKYHDYRYKQPEHYIECPCCGISQDVRRVFSEDGSTFDETVVPTMFVGSVIFYISNIDRYAVGCNCLNCGCNAHFYIIYDSGYLYLVDSDEVSYSSLYTSKHGFFIKVKDMCLLEGISNGRKYADGKIKSSLDMLNNQETDSGQ